MNCENCGGTFRVRSARGLKWENIPGVPMPIPSRIRLLRCDCDFGVSAEEEQEISAALRPLEMKWLRTEARRVIRLLRKREGISTAQIEAALGVGFESLQREDYNLTLVRLLQAFEVHPQELRRHLNRRPRPHD